MGRAHDGGNRRSLRSAQHREHASLFRARPAMRRASLGLRLARGMLLPSRLLRCNGNPLGGGDDLGCRCFDFVGGSRADACLLGSGLRLSVDVDRFEALLGDAKRHRPSFVIASPDRERAGGADLLQQAGADELIGSLRAAASLTFAGSSTPRSSRCEAADRMTSCVSVSLDIGILRWCGVVAATTTAPPRPRSRRGRIPRQSRARNGHTTALFADECQSFLDNVIAGLGHTG